jgi:hypothetical protein
MFSVIGYIIMGMGLAALSVGLFSAMPLPLAALNFSLILLVNAHIRLAHRDAFFMTIGMGLAYEALIPHTIPAAHFVLFLAVNSVMSLLSRKVFTHFSLLSSTVLHSIAAILWYGGIGIVSSLAIRLAYSEPVPAMSFFSWLSIFATHLAVSLLVTLLSYRLRQWLRTMFLVRAPRDWQPLL